MLSKATNSQLNFNPVKEEADENAFCFDLETPNGTKTIAVNHPEVVESNAIKNELQSFVNAIINDTPTVVSEMDGYAAMEVAHQIITKINAAKTVMN